MTRILKLSALAATTLVVSGAQANLIFSDAITGSSAAFVALNNNETISLTIDLGATFSSFLAASGTQGVAANTVANAGELSAPGTVARWNFATNIYTINGVAQAGTNAWNTQAASFFSQVGTDYRWGVMAADSRSGALSPTNTVRAQNLLWTNGVPVDFDNDQNTGTSAQGIVDGAGAISVFFGDSNLLTSNSTHAAGVRGANTATAGGAFAGTSMSSGGVGTWGSSQFGTNNAWVAPNQTSFFTWGNQTNPSTIISIGQTYAVGAVSSNPATWNWDASTSTLTYTVPVPEPGTYALFLAGLAGVGFLVRRRAR